MLSQLGVLSFDSQQEIDSWTWNQKSTNKKSSAMSDEEHQQRIASLSTFSGEVCLYSFNFGQINSDMLFFNQHILFFSIVTHEYGVPYWFLRLPLYALFTKNISYRNGLASFWKANMPRSSIAADSFCVKKCCYFSKYTIIYRMKMCVARTWRRTNGTWQLPALRQRHFRTFGNGHIQ